ncbi:MAG: GntR family transcriptional regulator [Lentisphaerota bacterium]
MTAKTKSGASQPLIRGRNKQRLLYRQLADVLRRDMQSGKLGPGAMLPSMDVLAQRHQLNKATVRQAITELAAAGLVYSIPAKGTFVAEKGGARAGGVSSRSLSIGWVLSMSDGGNTGRYHTEIMDAVQSSLRKINGHLLIINAIGMNTTALCRVIGEARLDGVILIGGFNKETIRHLAGNGLPAVLIDDTCRGVRIDSILVDNRGGGGQAVEHLLSLGHRELALVTGPQDLQITQDRRAGALEAAAAAGIPSSSIRILDGDFSPESGRAAAAKILAMRQRPTAVFFFNDEMASGALQTFHESGRIRIPQDMSIVSFDDVLWASLTQPPLTTIRVEKELMGNEAVERLKKRMTARHHIPETIIIPTQLMIRKTTAAPIQGGLK